MLELLPYFMFLDFIPLHIFLFGHLWVRYICKLNLIKKKNYQIKLEVEEVEVTR